jgi:membrane-associated protease RseP (regulator of RpoE activity)
MKARGKLHGDRDILFAVWSGEELGVLGSAHFVKDFVPQSKDKTVHRNIEAEINLDMVGRLRTNLVLQGAGSSSGWNNVISQANQKHVLSLVMQSDPYLPTDAMPFYLHGVPAINLFTGSHDEYHTPRDRPETLNYAGLQQITNFLVDLVVTLEAQPDILKYQYVKKTGGETGRGFKVYLGTIPDYASSDVSGVKLSGVTKDSPAEHAGLRQDDVIVELAGKKIHDIYDYSRVLNALHAGASVPLVVLRNQARLTLKIVAISRDQL